MVSITLLSLSTVGILYIASLAVSFLKNAAAAKRSGLPYVYSPVSPIQIGWILTQSLWTPILRKLPCSLTEPWLSLSLTHTLWHQGYKPFTYAQPGGADTFIVVSPWKNIVWTCDAHVITQTGSPTRHDDFPKPARLMKVLNIFGPTLTASLGQEARTYRKITAPALNEALFRKVWDRSLTCAAQLLNRWAAFGGLVSDLSTDMSHETLAVISDVCFGIELKNGDEKPRSHTLAYSDAMLALLNHANTLFFTPLPVLRNSPFASHKAAYLAYDEWLRYMIEMREQERARQAGVHKTKGEGSILEALVAHEASETEREDQNGSTESRNAISPAAVLGNIFIFIIAGHESTANTLAFALTMLACRPDVQEELHAALDAITVNSKNRDFSTVVPALLDGYVGAVMNEILRLYGALAALPRSTETPQSLEVDGKTCLIPGDSIFFVNVSATHRNPKYWPSAAIPEELRHIEALEGKTHPISSFDPSRWLQPDAAPTSTGRAGRRMKTPSAGTWIPFNEGARSCLGKHFAQVQFCAFIVQLLARHKVELYTPEVADMTKQDADRLRKQALADAVRALSDGVAFKAALKMGADVKLKFVPRD